MALLDRIGKKTADQVRFMQARVAVAGGLEPAFDELIGRYGEAAFVDDFEDLVTAFFDDHEQLGWLLEGKARSEVQQFARSLAERLAKVAPDD